MPPETDAMPHACDAPVVIDESGPTAADGTTFCGTDLRIVLPFANCPYRFRPQHQVVPAVVDAHTNSLPAVIAVGFFTEIVTGV